MIAMTVPVPSRMTLDEFLAWPGDGTGRKSQLVDGAPMAMAPASPTHGTIQANIVRLLGVHLLARSSACRAVTEPGVVPRVQADTNLRIPDVGVTCVPDDPRHRTLPDPVLLVEILSPGNETETWATETWANVWTFTSIPSVREILIVHSVRIAAELLRRQPDGTWPERPVTFGAADTLRLDSIGFACPLTDLYARTHLARAEAGG